MHIGLKIKEKRLKEGLSVPKLAAKIAVREANLYKWEAGTKPSDPEDYRKISEYLEEKQEGFPREKQANDALISARIEILMNAMAEVVSASSGENPAVIRKKFEKAAEELAKMA